MRVVFLDFDGVLNSDQTVIESDAELWSEHQIDTRPVALLNQLLERSGAAVVITSSWRVVHPSVEHLEGLLRSRGFVGEVLGVTPRLHRGADGERKVRGHEVAHWLAEHPEVGDYVILDDDATFLGHQEPRLVRTSAAAGLTEADVERAVEILLRASR